MAGEFNGHVTVLGIQFEVRETEMDENDGLLEFEKRLIRIDPTGKNPGLTLKHELIHAVLGITGWDEIVDKDEGLTRALELGLDNHIEVEWD